METPALNHAIPLIFRGNSGIYSSQKNTLVFEKRAITVAEDPDYNGPTIVVVVQDNIARDDTLTICL
jgi:hypothetical protein